MKQLSIVCGSVLLGVGIFFMFQRCHPPVQLDSGLAAGKPITVCYECVPDHFNGLSAEDFETGIKRYKQKRSDLIDREVLEGSKPDARNCWYSLDTLKNFICQIESYSKLRNIPANLLGIRFHYAVYPDVKPDNPDYARLHTLYLSATVAYQGVNEDFDPRYLATAGSEVASKSDARLKRGYQGIHTSGGDTASLVSSFIYNIYLKHPKEMLLVMPHVAPQIQSLGAGTGGVAGTLGGATQAMTRNQGQLCPNYPNCPTTY